MRSKAGSKANAYLEALGVLVHYYEQKRFPVKGKAKLTRPYNELVWKRFWNDPEFAKLLADEVARQHSERPKNQRKK